MAQIRSLSDLQNEMAAEFAWRKKELHQLKVTVSANEKMHTRDLYIRAAITLLYAHWEGFIKRVGSAYLEFVARQGLRNNELPSQFLALIVGQLVRKAMATSKLQPSLDVVDFFLSQANLQSKLNWKSAIRTKSNLNAALFQEIVLSLGLDYSRFATKEKLIDEKLLRNRNSIAHGQFLLVNFKEYMDLHEEILGIMQDFYNQVENSAFTGAYRRPP